MADTILQLKRKRESAGAQAKKSKKPRKSDTGAARDTAKDSEVAVTSEAPSATNAQVSLEDAPVPHTNGVREDAPPSAKLSNGLQNGNADGSHTEDSPATTSTKISKEERKKQKRASKLQSKNSVNGEGVQPTQSQALPTPSEPPPQVPDTENPTKRKERQSKKEKKADQGLHTADIAEAQSATSSLQVTAPTKTKKEKSKSRAEWSISPPRGGWFLASDPIFSRDEKYILLANLKSIQIYSVDTSLLANVLPVGATGVVTAYALSSTKPNHLYVADSNEAITLWDWVDGKQISTWDMSATIRNMAIVTQPGSDEDLVYCYEPGNSHVVNVHALRTKSQASTTEHKLVLETTSAILSVQVLLQGKYVLITTVNSITIGKRLKVSKTAVQDFDYVWRELKFTNNVTTCSMYYRQRDVSETGKKSAKDQREVLDLAVGDEVGVVLLFEDILASFAAIEGNQKTKEARTDNAESLRPKRLHWHREAVGSVKWSLDGNYIISGGDETVLTIWQLATGKQQQLPHLTAAIENIVVSPSGSSYALTLANNSVIVLSTTELDAKSNIGGIQSRRVDQDQLPRESSTRQPSFNVFRHVPMVVDPKNANELLLSVPASQPRQNSGGPRPEPYLQTFDIASYRAVTRQALTRNNATDPNMGPEGRRIIEPSVHLLQISHDGEWLATVDEWIPPRGDTTYLNQGIPEFDQEEHLLRREVYLKFWRRDEKNGQWVLEARVDAPHFFEEVCGHGRVFDLVADPTEHGFATIGDDHIVRIWRPKTRLRDGIVVRGAGDKGLVNWSIHRSIQLPNPNKNWMPEAGSVSPQILSLQTSRLAFSPDGSVLAAAVSGTFDVDSGLVHLLDPFSATIRSSMTEIDTTVLCGLGIVGSYLVAVTDSIAVWDLVNAKLAYTIPIDTPGINQSDRTSVIRLALNQDDGTFAVSLPQFEKKESSSRVKKPMSTISVYNTEKPEPLWTHKTAAITLALAPRKGSIRGYVALDSVSCIRTITPGVHTVKRHSSHRKETAELKRVEKSHIQEIEDVGGGLTAFASIDVDADEYDRPVVKQQDLVDLFHTNAALPPPKDMFKAVLGLFGGAIKAAA